MPKRDPRIHLVRRPTLVQWIVYESEKLITNGAENNERKAVKAAEHALRMIDKESASA